MMNDICIDIDYQQIYKHGQQIGGDVFLLDRKMDSNMITATLSDGVGSGVKANVQASLTSHMANKLSFSAIDLKHSAEIIMDTLPVVKEKGISYATFTIAQIVYSSDKSFINVDLVEYDNPVSLRFSGSQPVEWEKMPNTLNRKTATRKEIVYSSSFSMQAGDRLIFFSDGVAQSGVSLGKLPGRKPEPAVYGMKLPSVRPADTGFGPMGWGEDKVKEFISDLLRRKPEISSRDLTREIVTQA